MSQALLLCQLDSVRFAVAAADVQEVVRAVAWTQLPGQAAQSENALGLINRRGQWLPLVDTWTFFGIPARQVRPADFYVVLSCDRGQVAVVVSHLDRIMHTDGELDGVQLGFTGSTALRVINSNVMAEQVSGVLEQLSSYHLLNG